MVHLAVFGVSFASLAFEVLLARIFAISQWHHLSFMVISVALFGFAASGSFLSLVDLTRWSRAGRGSPSMGIAMLSLLCSTAIILSFLGLASLPLDYFRLVLEPVQLLYLLAIYLILILPFVFAGGVIVLAYVVHPQHPGPIYFASMTGSALGALAPAVLLGAIGEPALLALSAFVPAIMPLAGLRSFFPGEGPFTQGSVRKAAGLLGAAALACAAGIGLLTPWAGERFPITPSEYKPLSQALQFPDTRIAASVPGIRGRIDRVQSPHLRFAPGLSLKYTDPLPAAEALFTDGDQPLFLYEPRPSAQHDFARFTLSFLGYEIVGAPERVLLVMSAGGLAAACARASGAQTVRIVQPDPHLAEMIRRHYGFEVVCEIPRAHLARTRETFDVIHIESWGPSLPGVDALHQDHLLTVDGLAECLRHLTPQGVLILSRRLLLPPSGTLRMWSTVREALVAAGAEEPERCIVMLRNWDTFTLVASRRPIQRPQQILESARRLNFDVAFLNDAAESDANRFNVFDAPYHFRELQRLESAARAGRQDDFFSGYLLDVRPRTDLQPFPGRFLKWDRIGDLYHSLGSRRHALFLAGETVVAVVFVQAFALAVVLLLIPAVAVRKKAGTGSRFHGIYFLGIGAGFIFAELLFVHAGTFFLGDPVVSLAVVLTALLVSSGAGGLWAQRLEARWVRLALLAAAAALLLAAVGFWACGRELLALPPFGRCAALSVGVMIPGFAMGLPFPLGMRFLARRPVERTLAWAVNGCASVLGSIATAQLAISAGLPWILWSALASYGLALWQAAETRDGL